MTSTLVVREATEPPEARGITRDAVRMMVAYRHDLRARARARARPPAVPRRGRPRRRQHVGHARRRGRRARRGRHAARRAPLAAAARPACGSSSCAARTGVRPSRGSTTRRAATLRLVGGGVVRLATRFESSTGLWVATLDLPDPVLTYLAVHGRPIRYGYVTRDWPLDTYQNVYAREPGSAEMPSAGRPFTPELVTRLVAKGVGVTPIVLHTGVSSLEANEHPYPEWYRVAAVDGGARQRDPRRRRPRRSRSARRSCARSSRSSTDRGVVHPGDGLDRRRGHARAGRDSGRRPAHRLARARGVTPADARSGRRPDVLDVVVRRRLGRGLPLARVRRRPPPPPVTGFGDDRRPFRS